jgi:hypothetical protein
MMVMMMMTMMMMMMVMRVMVIMIMMLSSSNFVNTVALISLQAFDQYDLSGAGVMELPEFLSFLHCQAEEAEEKISGILHYKIMSAATSLGVKYVPPEEGVMRLSVIDSYTKKSSHNVMTHVDHSHVMEATDGQTENLPKLLLYSLNGSKLRLKQGLALVNSIIGETRNRPATLAKILPYMLNSTEARMLIGRVSVRNNACADRLLLRCCVCSCSSDAWLFHYLSGH